MEELASFILGVICLAILLGFIPGIGPTLGALVILLGGGFVLYCMFNA